MTHALPALALAVALADGLEGSTAAFTAQFTDGTFGIYTFQL